MSRIRDDRSAVQKRVQPASTHRRLARKHDLLPRRRAGSGRGRAAEQAAPGKCERSRARLETYLQSRRLYRTDEDGERVYLDDDADAGGPPESRRADRGILLLNATSAQASRARGRYNVRIS